MDYDNNDSEWNLEISNIFTDEPDARQKCDKCK